MQNREWLEQISVIIPAYNSSKTIERALDSVKKQTKIKAILEIFVVDDGSKDSTADIVAQYIKKNPELPIKLIRKENGGASSARNVGMKVAKGKYIALLDSDDEWLPDKIDRQMSVLIANPNIDFLGGNYNGKELRILNRKIDTLYKANIKDLCIKFFPVTPSAIFKKEIVDKIGYFREDQFYAEDGNYFMRICENYNYYHLPEQVVICGGGKPEFGYSGLSSNLKGMYDGNVHNIKELRDRKSITKGFYYGLRIFYLLKHIRRIIICHTRKVG